MKSSFAACLVVAVLAVTGCGPQGDGFDESAPLPSQDEAVAPGDDAVPSAPDDGAQGGDADGLVGAPAEDDPGEPQGSGEDESGWVTLFAEDFESGDLPAAVWQADTAPDDGPFSDAGVLFQQREVVPPRAWRFSLPFGDQEWLTLEAYTREENAEASRFASVVADPADPSNRALQIASRDHTDATVVRPSSPLPERYRVSLRVGFADFGNGLPGPNGYDDGRETAEPWSSASATSQNGFYWLTILDAMPRPHNSVWIHHHRKVVVYSDNHYPALMEVFDGSGFVWSGENPVMMFALDGRSEGELSSGKPFISYSGGSWQPSGKIRAVDAYLPGEWYSLSIERDGTRFTIELSGRFRYAGQQTWRASIDAAERCVWHYNRPYDPPAEHCVDESYFPELGADHPLWPAGGSWDDWFMFGDPHANYYEGSVLYDDVKLEVWR